MGAMDTEMWIFRSPDHPHSLVLLKLPIAGDDGNVFRQSRRNQHSVKRVAMMGGQSKQPQGLTIRTVSGFSSSR